MADCTDQKRNVKDCTCTYMACDKLGLCYACIVYHLSIGVLHG